MRAVRRVRSARVVGRFLWVGVFFVVLDFLLAECVAEAGLVLFFAELVLAAVELLAPLLCPATGPTASSAESAPATKRLPTPEGKYREKHTLIRPL